MGQRGSRRCVLDRREVEGQDGPWDASGSQVPLFLWIASQKGLSRRPFLLKTVSATACHGDLGRGRSRVGLVRQSTGRSLITLLVPSENYIRA
jgi:hypothetical protein